MNTYERLREEACMDGIDVIDYVFQSDQIKGLYCDGAVAINQAMDTAQKACTLAEELGHHYTSVGNILDLEDVSNRKQERQARLWGYNKQIGLAGLIKAYEAGCQNRYETAAYLEVTEEFLEECIQCYQDKYGEYKIVGNYTIYFIPHLAVFKRV